MFFLKKRVSFVDNELSLVKLSAIKTFYTVELFVGISIMFKFFLSNVHMLFSKNKIWERMCLSGNNVFFFFSDLMLLLLALFHDYYFSVNINQYTTRIQPYVAVLTMMQRSCFFFYCTELLIFVGIIFCSSIALVWTFNTRDVYNFITKEANIPVNLVPFFNDISFLFYRFLKSGVTNELSLFLWKSKKVNYSKHGKILLLIKR